MTPSESFPRELVSNDCTKNIQTISKSDAKKPLCDFAYPETHGILKSIIFSRSGNFLITSFNSGIIELRDFPGGHVTREWQFSRSPATCVRFHPEIEGLLFASHANGTIRQFRTAPKNIIDETFAKEKYDVKAMDLSHDGNFLATASNNKRIRIYQVETKKLISVWRTSKTADSQRFHSSPVVAVRWFPDDSNMLASAGWDNTIRIWDIRDLSGSVMAFNGPNVLSSDGIDVNGNYLIAGSWEACDCLTLWDLQAGRKVRNINVTNRNTHGDGDFLYCAKFWKSYQNAKGRYVIIGGSGTKCVEMVDLKTDKIVCRWPKFGAVVSLTSSNSLIAWGGTAPVLTIAEYHGSKIRRRKRNVESCCDVERSPEQHLTESQQKPV